MIMPYFLWRKQKVYRWVCNRNIESGGNKISNGGVGGLWNWRWPLIKCQITYLRSYIEQWWVKGGRGGEEGDKRNRLVHIQQDHIKICVIPQTQKSLGLFSNVIFLSQNFILTSCIANLTWFLAKKNLRQTLSINFIQRISSNSHRPGAYLQFQLKGGALIGRRTLIKKLLICTNSAVLQTL